MKVSSKDLYRELRLLLAPKMKQQGFNSLTGGRLGWTRNTSKGHLSVWFQCDKWGWDKQWGSKFTVEFQLTDQSSQAMTLAGRFDRIGYLLEGFPELDELRLRNNAVIERLPGTARGMLITGQLPDGTEFVAVGEKVDPNPAIYGRDIWLNYYSIEDAREWARYFEANLLRFISIFENELKSEQQHARDRHDGMIGQVQRASDISQKARILEEYVKVEKDPHFASVAENLLNEMRSKYRHA